MSNQAAPQFALDATLAPEGYWLKTVFVNGVRYTVVAGADDSGVLYGSFALLRKIGTGASIAELDEKQAPSSPIRWLNLWDFIGAPPGAPGAGAGPGGVSIIYDQGKVRDDLSRLDGFARMLASVGINGAAIAIVNADPRLMSEEWRPELVRIAGILRPWGIRMVLPADFGSPEIVGGMDTYNTNDPRVAEWWNKMVSDLYEAVPDMAGFVMKADSEGTRGPAAYKLSIASAANTIARALKPHGGLLLYRAFVYNHHADWNDMKADRARDAYDNFHQFDGQFEDNVVIQIKNGPIDFQVREPASPLFSGLEKTNQAIELEVVQEYLGGGRHLVYLVPWWKDNLDFDLKINGDGTPVKDVITGKVFHRPLSGFVGVTITSADDTWCRGQFAQENLYGFGRLAWDPNLSARQIADEWTRQTFGQDPLVVRTAVEMELRSWSVYEKYTGPLGLQTLTEITGNHYGVAVEASENNGWGQWHRADAKGVGMNRTMATGTGYTGQYRPAVAKMFESLDTCPDDLLLWFHHVPYTHMLHRGTTVIQYLYDSHYEGAEQAAEYVRDWKLLDGRIDEQRYNDILAQLTYQAGAAQLWRDAVAGWFYKTSGIEDEKGRVGHYPNRHEAESMKLTGYEPLKVERFETASGETAVLCKQESCSASFQFDGKPGWYTLNVRYFDYAQGQARLRLWVGDQMIEEWAEDATLPTRRPIPDGTASVRRLISGVALRPGDQIRIEGIPDPPEDAALDYVEVLPERN